MLRGVLPLMRVQGHGVIVQISSLAGIASFPSEALYGASKHALEAVCEALHHEVAPHGIRVAVIEPGWFPTSMDDNAVRSPATTVDSPYHPAEDAFWTAVDRMRSSQAAPDPQLVADAIATAVHDPHSPFRTPVGTDASTVVELLHQTSFEELSSNGGDSGATDHLPPHAGHPTMAWSSRIGAVVDHDERTKGRRGSGDGCRCPTGCCFGVANRSIRPA